MSVWVVSRAAGLAALWLLVASAAAGYAVRSLAPDRSRWAGPLAYLHIAFAGAGWASAWLHAWLLRYDPYVPFDWRALWVPGTAPYRPVGTAMGTLALYGWGVVLLSFDGRRRLGAGWFRRLHGVAPAVLGLSAWHVVGTGSDLHLLAVRAGAGALLGLAAMSVVERWLARRGRPLAGRSPRSAAGGRPAGP